MTKSTNKTKTAEGVRKASEKVTRKTEYRVEYHPHFINLHKTPAQWKEFGINFILKMTELRFQVEQSGDTTFDQRAEVCFKAHDAIESITAVICCNIVNFDEIANPDSIEGKSSRMVLEMAFTSAKKFIDEIAKIDAFKKQAEELLSWCEDQLAR